MYKTFSYFKNIFLIAFLSLFPMCLANEVPNVERFFKNEILVESDKQSTDSKYSIFYAEGNVLLTNKENEFSAKSKKAVFYKDKGKIKLIGNVEVSTNDSKIIRAGEVIYYVNEKRFEALSDLKQRVSTTIIFSEK